MENMSDDSNSSVGSYRERNSPLNFSKSQCQMSTKASAFSIDALIGRKRTLAAQLQKTDFPSSVHSSDDDEDSCDPAKRLCCGSPSPGQHVGNTDQVPMAPLGSYSDHNFRI